MNDMLNFAEGGGRLRRLKAVFAVLISICMIAMGGVVFVACGETETAAVTYKVLLFDEDRSTLLYAAQVEENAILTDVKTPTKEADTENTYKFSGWVDIEGNPVTLAFINEDILAYATYASTPIEQSSFKILLLDEDKSKILYAETVDYGTTLTDITAPVKEADAENTYTFAGWVDESGNPITLAFINKDITAYASYTATPIDYTLTVLGNEVEVYSQEKVSIISEGYYLTTGMTVHYGDLLQIVVNGTDGYYLTDTPSFIGLKGVVGEDNTYMVTGDVTISYTEAQEEYTVMFYDSNGEFLASVDGLHYGDSVTYPESLPEKSPDLRASYEFAGWVDEDGNSANLKKITGDSVFTAVYKETYIDYSFKITDCENSSIAVYKNGTQIYSGSVVHYQDVLTVVITPNEGYYVSALNVNGTQVSVSSNQATIIVDDNGVDITYSVQIYTFSVTFYNLNSVYDTKSNVTYGSAISDVTDPEEYEDDYANYVFANWCDEDGNVVSLTCLKSDGVDIVLYASYTQIPKEYEITASSYVTVTSNGVTLYSGDTLHWNDTFTVSYELPDGYTMYDFAVTATENGSAYTVSGDIEITLLMEKTFVADAWNDDMQVFNGFKNSSGSDIAVSACSSKNGYITIDDVQSYYLFYYYTYRGEEEVTLTAKYTDFTMSPINFTSVNDVEISHSSSNYSNFTWTATQGSQGSGIFYADYVTTALYRGMEIEFTYTVNGNMQLFGLATANQLGIGTDEDGPENYTWSSGTQWDRMFVPTYNVYSSSSDFKQLVSTMSSTNMGGSVAFSNNTALSNSYTYTIRLVLGSYLQVYITNNSTGVTENLNEYTSTWTITAGQPYYLVYWSTHSTATATFTSLNYEQTMESAYVASLSASTATQTAITILGDSITAGAGTSWGTGSTADRYSTLLASSLGLTEKNMGVSGTVYCEGYSGSSSRASRIYDVLNISTTSKFVVVLLGTNDFDNASLSWATLGSLGSTDTTTIYGALEVMYSLLAELQSEYGIKVYICTTVPTGNDLSSAAANDGVSTLTCGAGYTLAQLVKAEKDVAAKYGLTVIDLYNGVDWDSDWFTSSVQTESTGSTGNNLHPNADGHAAMAEYIYNQIVEEYKYDYALSLITAA